MDKELKQLQPEDETPVYEKPEVSSEESLEQEVLGTTTPAAPPQGCQ